MAGRTGAPNRGPAAAPENRAAILDAARRLFREQGYAIPLSLAAREAGVSQGVLYRHFPTKLDLALAVFADNFTEAEELATSEGASFWRSWKHLVDLSVRDHAFIEMSMELRHRDPQDALHTRFARFLSPLLEQAKAQGEISQSVTIDLLLITLRSIFGIVFSASTPQSARASTNTLLAALSLLPPNALPAATAVADLESQLGHPQG